MQLSVEYLVLTEATFERLYRQRRQETERAERFVLPQSIQQSPEVRTIAAVQPSLCVGHFENFPALPLAVILWEIGQIAADLFAEPFWLREASIDAHDLCWAGESARFEAALGPRDTAPNSGCSYVGRASSGGHSLAELRAELAPRPRDPEASSPELL